MVKNMEFFRRKFWESKISRKLIILTAAFVVLAGVIAAQGMIIYKNRRNFNFNLVQKTCNVARVNLYGDLATYVTEETDSNGCKVDQASADAIVAAIEKAKNDKSIKAILLEIESRGGKGIAGEEIANALKQSGKPTVVLIKNLGLSAAYLAATGADWIIASDLSEVGDIGVTASYVDNSQQNKDQGLTFNQLSVGKFKDAGNSDKELTLEEKDILMRNINILYDNFVKAVAVNRHLSIERVMALADGSSLVGQKAKDSSLIDQVGGISEAKKYISQKIGKDAVICN